MSAPSTDLSNHKNSRSFDIKPWNIGDIASNPLSFVEILPVVLSVLRFYFYFFQN